MLAGKFALSASIVSYLLVAPALWRRAPRLFRNAFPISGSRMRLLAPRGSRSSALGSGSPLDSRLRPGTLSPTVLESGPGPSRARVMGRPVEMA